MSLAGGIFGQKNLSRAQDAFCAVTSLDLDFTLKHDHILPPRRVVKIKVIVAVRFPKAS